MRHTLVAALVCLLLTPATAAAADALGPLRSGCAAKRSTDRRPVPYRICSGTVPSFDGTPLDVTLTLPAHPGRRALPLLVLLHGLLSDKGEYISQTAAGTGPDRGPGASYKTVDFNNVSLAARGYAVLTYSARGHGNSGGSIDLDGPDTLHDTRWVTGLLADAKWLRVDPRRVGIAGGSYGGGQTWLLLTTRAGKGTNFGQWRSPQGRLLSIAVAVPGFTWTDLVSSLAPNGHQLSTGVVDPAHADDPVGVLKLTIANGFLATARNRLPDYTIRWLTRTDAGEPYAGDAQIQDAIRGLQARSAYFRADYFAALRAGRARKVPILAAQGWTDPILPALEAVRMYNRLRSLDRRYPIALYFGDMEHLNSLAKVSDFRYWHGLANRLLDRFLLHRGRGIPYRATSATSNCDPKRLGPLFSAPTFAGLARHRTVFKLAGPQQTVSTTSDPRARDLDPALISIQRGRTCLRTTAAPGAGVAFWTIPVRRAFTLAGFPRLRIAYSATASDLEVNGRLWDVAPDGTATLVTRGAYRATKASGTITTELFGNAWRFPAGHRLQLELTQDDATYLRPDNVPSTATISSVRLELPVR